MANNNGDCGCGGQAANTQQSQTQAAAQVDANPTPVPCDVTVHETVCVEALVTITADVTADTASAFCVGPAKIGPCPHPLSQSCTFFVHQNVCVQIPLHFTATATAASQGIACNIEGPAVGPCVNPGFSCDGACSVRSMGADQFNDVTITTFAGDFTGNGNLNVNICNNCVASNANLNFEFNPNVQGNNVSFEINPSDIATFTCDGTTATITGTGTVHVGANQQTGTFTITLTSTSANILVTSGPNTLLSVDLPNLVTLELTNCPA